MVTRKSSKPAGRGVKDDEVKTQSHDALLFWSIDNLPVVFNQIYGMDEEEAKASLLKACSWGKDWVEGEFLEQLRSFAEGISDPKKDCYYNFNKPAGKLSKETREMLSKAVGRAKAVSKKISEAEICEGLGSAGVNGFEVMKPAYKAERHLSRETKVHEAGYIDIEVTVFIPKEFEIAIQGIERSPSKFNHITNLSEEKDFQKLAQAFVPANVSILTKGLNQTVWLTVRSSSFTLGEILQELKTLCKLNEETQKVMLVVDGIDAKMRANIEREGFVVIDKSDYANVD